MNAKTTATIDRFMHPPFKADTAAEMFRRSRAHAFSECPRTSSRQVLVECHNDD
jgi:hypothetical protein